MKIVLLCIFSATCWDTDWFFFFFTLAETHICEYGQAGRADPVSCLPNQHRNASFQSICTPTCRDLNAMSPKRKRFYCLCSQIHLRWIARRYVGRLSRTLPKWTNPYPLFAGRVLRILFIGSYVRAIGCWTQKAGDVKFFFSNRIIQSWEHSFFIKLGPNQNQNDPSRLTRRKREAISPNNKRFYRVWPLIHLRRVTCRGDQLLPQYEAKCCWSYPSYAYELGAFSETRSSGPKFGPVDDKPSSSLLLRFFANRITQSRKISKFVFASEKQRQIIFYAFLPMSLTIWLQIYTSGYSSQSVDYSKCFFFANRITQSWEVLVRVFRVSG